MGAGQVWVPREAQAQQAAPSRAVCLLDTQEAVGKRSPPARSAAPPAVASAPPGPPPPAPAAASPPAAPGPAWRAVQGWMMGSWADASPCSSPAPPLPGPGAHLERHLLGCLLGSIALRLHLPQLLVHLRVGCRGRPLAPPAAAAAAALLPPRLPAANSAAVPAAASAAAAGGAWLAAPALAALVGAACWRLGPASVSLVPPAGRWLARLPQLGGCQRALHHHAGCRAAEARGRLWVVFLVGPCCTASSLRRRLQRRRRRGREIVGQWAESVKYRASGHLVVLLARAASRAACAAERRNVKAGEEAGGGLTLDLRASFCYSLQEADHQRLAVGHCCRAKHTTQGSVSV